MSTFDPAFLGQKVVEATVEIFETMIMADIAAKEPLPEQIKEFKHNVSGIIGLAGTHQGMLAIHAPEEVAKGITFDFLGVEVESIDEDVKDAISEMANMIAGSVKPALSANGKDIQLSIPSVFHGNYSVNYYSQADWAMVPFEISSGLFLVEFQLKKAE